MFIDDARALLEARGTARQTLLEAWQESRLRFLAGRLPAPEMLAAQSALRRADADPLLAEQVQEALLSPLQDAGVEARLLALFQDLTEAQGDDALRARQEQLGVALEVAWLAPPAPVFGKVLARRELLRVLADSRLEEERRPAWQALTAPGRESAAQVEEWLGLEEELARAAGWSCALERQEQRLGLDPGRARRWLDELRASLGPAIRAAAENRLSRLSGQAGRSAGALTLGALYPAGAIGRAGLPLEPLPAAWSRKDPLELVRDAAELLGLDVEAPLAAWARVADLPGWLQGVVPGPEGRWPVVLLDLRGEVHGLRRALRCLGEGLGLQATAVGLADPGESPGPAFPFRRLQALALGAWLSTQAGEAEVARRLLEDFTPGQEAWWREQRLLELGQDLLRVDWLLQDPASGTPGERWLTLRREWLAQPLREEDAPLWAVDAWLGTRSGESLARLAARLLAAGLEARWRGLVPAASPEQGGLLLESLTEPDDPELWEACADRLLEALDPAALIHSLAE